MSIYAIADLHLSNNPCTEKPMDIFGDRWFNHAERIEQSWRSIVGKDDTVVVAGDISWGLKLEEAVFDLEWIDSLPGRKIILKGNHDLWWAGIKKLNSMYESITFLQNEACFIKDNDGRGTWICGSRGWITPDDDDFDESDEKIYKREILRLQASLEYAAAGRREQGMEGEIIGFLHYPPASGHEYFSGFMQLFEDYGVRNVYYGHLHGEDAFRKAIQGNYHGIEYRLISADYLNCRPLLIKGQEND